MKVSFLILYAILTLSHDLQTYDKLLLFTFQKYLFLNKKEPSLVNFFLYELNFQFLARVRWTRYINSGYKIHCMSETATLLTANWFIFRDSLQFFFPLVSCHIIYCIDDFMFINFAFVYRIIMFYNIYRRITKINLKFTLFFLGFIGKMFKLGVFL